MGTFLVIDGADGSGKATQVGLLTKRLESEGQNIKTIDFPQYATNHFGALLRECLDGKRGDFMKVDPRIASTLYAADRYESSTKIREWLESDCVVIADRYVSSNMLHQGAKISDEKERKDFLTWLDEIEHGVFKIPRPDYIIYLDIPYMIRRAMMHNDQTRKRLDMAEEDDKHQIATEKSAQSLVASLNNWQTISCVQNDKLRSKEAIHEEIYQIVITKIASTK